MKRGGKRGGGGGEEIKHEGNAVLIFIIITIDIVSIEAVVSMTI